MVHECYFEILHSLRLQPCIRNFHISINDIDEFILLRFLGSHPQLTEVCIHIDVYDNFSGASLGLGRVHLPNIERFEAPFTYWEILASDTPKLYHAGIYSDRMRREARSHLVFAPFEKMKELGECHLRSVEIWTRPGTEEVGEWMARLKNLVPDLEELSVRFEHIAEHGEPSVRIFLSSLALFLRLA